jgi:predicted metal-dependent peptidase
MKFSRVIGKIDPKLVARAEKHLSAVFLELATRYTNEHVGTGIGGDPLIFTLMDPVDHICTMNIPTAATDGKRFYWNPKFILKFKTLGLRIICAHEAWHAIYMHPQRRGSRLPKLWNIAVDYIVNGTVMDDFKARGMKAAHEFTTNLGRFMPLDKYAELVKNPLAKIEGFEDINPMDDSATPSVDLPAPDDDRELTPEEIREIEKREKVVRFYYADPDLAPEMKRPEKIYDYLYSLLPKCPKCGRVGIYKLPKKGQDEQKSGGQSSQPDQGDGEKEPQQGKGNQPGENHDHGNGQPCNCPNHGHGDSPSQGEGSGDGDDVQDSQGQGQGPGGKGCDECSGGIDIFGLGGTVDDHMDTSESEEKLAKRIADAMEATRRMAGHVPAALEEELGKLVAPKITWQDIIRTRLLKARAGNGRNDWTRFRTRPMFVGLLVPKRKSYYAHFGCLLDTSGSMSPDDMAFGLSQLTSLDERSEGTIVPADAEIYWDKSTKIKKANAEELKKVKVVGRGGTLYASFFDDYKKHIGHCDFLVVVTDGFLLDQDVANMKHPGIDVIWLVTGASNFNPPFGRAFDLRG